MDALNIIVLFINICGYIFWLGLFANVIYWVLPNKFKSTKTERISEIGWKVIWASFFLWISFLIISAMMVIENNT